MTMHSKPLPLAPDGVPSDPPPTTDPSSRRLIVLIPGAASDSSTWTSLRERLEQEEGYRPDEATWFPFDYGREMARLKWFDKLVPGLRLLQSQRLDHLAHQLRARIDGEWAQNDGFDEIVLIGHSIGGLIARKVYLLAAGAVPNARPSVWGHRVSRIVLFASPNRGNKVKWAWWVSPLSWLLHTFPSPHLLYEDAIRGSNFLTNLRIDWIRHFSSNADDILDNYQKRGEKVAGVRHFTLPRIVQFLGDNDKLVDYDDSKDILGFADEYYQRIADADHTTVYRLEPKFALDPDARYALLREAFTEKSPKNLYSPPPKLPGASDDKQIVFLLHGIRASNVDSWIATLGSKLEAIENTIVVRPEYGYFSAIGFALPRTRRKNIRFFQDSYGELLAQYPHAKFHIIAHSNGTYMLGYSMEKTPGMQFKNVVLAGSALPEEYQWTRLSDGQVERVLNERASRDWPIALLCRALAAIGQKDVGRSGFVGFYGSSASEVAYYKGGHGAALEPANHERLVKYILGKNINSPDGLLQDPGFFRWLSNFMPYVAWTIVIGIPALILWLSFYQGTFDPRPITVSLLAFAALYVILDTI